MNPRLVGAAGPLKGSIFALSGAELTLGREESNSICIPEPSISRRHCAVEYSSGTVTLVDLESRNGTSVNGAPVARAVLQHGDCIKVGNSQFLFLSDEPESARTVDSIIVDDEETTKTTVQLSTGDALYLQPERVMETLPETARVARDLNTLLKISATINSIRRLEELESRLLESVFEVVPAERGAILLSSGDTDDYSSIFTLAREAGSKQALRLSRTVINRVLREGVAILSNNPLESSALEGSESLILGAVSSVLAVPLKFLDRRLGVLYLDTQDMSVQFDESHMQLVTAIAAMAAVSLDTARRLEWLETENRRLNAEINIEHQMVGESARVKEVYRFISKAAPADSTVLVRGESGTGKELVARAIHRNSRRAEKPFVAINCAAITDTLLESELFGYEKGAFSGATTQKKGKLEAADGGTLFLDEIGELALPLQAKLLRVLQMQEFERVGGIRPVKVDIRLIAATNKDLQQAIRDATFRQDLYYRLNVVSVSLPPLRERREDIPLLAGYFASRFAEKVRRRVIGISDEARGCLMNYHWPGNVRELENAIERAVVLGSSEVLLPEDLPEAVLEVEAGRGTPVAKYHEAVVDTKKQMILQAVEQAHGNYTDAAKLLGVHPNYLHRLIRNMNLKALLKKADTT
jgi:Nif-specific regulatory protein